MTIDELRARMREAAVAVENAGDDLGLFSERHGEFQRLASPANVKALDAEITRLREDLDRVTRERDGFSASLQQLSGYIELAKERREAAEAVLAKRVEKARKVVAAIEDANDRSHGAAAAWCPDEAVELIAAALAAAEAGEQPVAWRHRWIDTHNANRTPDLWRVGHEPVEPIDLEDGWKREVQPLYASPPSEASRDERAVFPTIERELVACLEADGIECEQVGHAWTADVSKRTELDVTGLAVAIATAVRARGET